MVSSVSQCKIRNRSQRPNGLRFSRREASAASEAVGWKRLLARSDFNACALDKNSFISSE
jgi:hypothetical protein